MDRVRKSYDKIARRYAEEIGDELAGKPVDRALYGLFAELVKKTVPWPDDFPMVGDLGCGPGHIAAHLSGLGLRPIGVDLSPVMIEVARERYPWIEFSVGAFPQEGAAPVPTWAGAVAAYSVIHFDAGQRQAAWRGLAGAIRPGGWLLVAFHVEAEGQPVGSVKHTSEWWDRRVDLDFHFLDPARTAGELAEAGFDVVSRTDREPWPEVEFPSRRCYLLARLRTVIP